MHTRKADKYGTDDDALANYVIASAVIGEADEFTPALRILEKIVRALNELKSGGADDCEEWPDIAALAIGAEALRRRRQSPA